MIHILGSGSDLSNGTEQTGIAMPNLGAPFGHVLAPLFLSWLQLGTEEEEVVAVVADKDAWCVCVYYLPLIVCSFVIYLAVSTTLASEFLLSLINGALLLCFS